jgi:hypothetical protein
MFVLFLQPTWDSAWFVSFVSRQGWHASRVFCSRSFVCISMYTTRTVVCVKLHRAPRGQDLASSQSRRYLRQSPASGHSTLNQQTLRGGAHTTSKYVTPHVTCVRISLTPERDARRPSRAEQHGAPRRLPLHRVLRKFDLILNAQMRWCQGRP